MSFAFCEISNTVNGAMVAIVVKVFFHHLLGDKEQEKNTFDQKQCILHVVLYTHSNWVTKELQNQHFSLKRTADRVPF